MKKKGFSYSLEDEKIIEYMKLSTREKLEWLEAISTFSRKALGKREKRINNILKNQ